MVCPEVGRRERKKREEAGEEPYKEEDGTPVSLSLKVELILKVRRYEKYIILSVLFTLFGLVSCYDDDSSLGTKNIGDITIGTLEDASIISYSGNKLIREPEIETTYPTIN